MLASVVLGLEVDDVDEVEVKSMSTSFVASGRTVVVATARAVD